jgi:Icc-related predicted phosphoesterase
MRLLFVADLHYSLKQYDWLIANAVKFDVVMIGGDLLDMGSILDIETQIMVVEKYLLRLSRQVPVLVSSGNHDGDGHNKALESICQWLREAKEGQLHVDGDGVMIGESLITICPWWDGPGTQAEVENLLTRDAARAKKQWIWIHHAPPAGSPICWNGKKSIGDEVLADWIKQYSPDFVLSGHIHNAPFYANGAWIDRMGNTWIFNPGRQIGPQPSFIVLDFDALSARWHSAEEDDKRDLSAPVAGVSGA